MDFSNLSRLLDSFKIKSINWSRINANLATLLFWGWVVVVSVWIEETSVDDPKMSYTDSSSEIHFTEMHYEQQDLKGTQLTLTSPKANYLSEEKQIVLTRPRLQWRSGDAIVKATATIGFFETNVDYSAMPSELTQLELIKGAYVEGMRFKVDSERILFDNIRRRFLLPEPFSFKQEDGTEGQSPGGYEYDPVKDEFHPVKDTETSI